jgi:hypothetical protein
MDRRTVILTGLMFAAAVVASVPTKLRIPHAKIDLFLAQSAWKAQQTVRPRLATVPLGTAKAHIAAEYVKLPLSFEPNLGQTNRAVRFLSRGNGYALYLTANEAFLSLRRLSPNGVKDRPSPFYKIKMDGPASTLLRMKLVGADPVPKISGIEELPGKSNYFVGNNPQTWQRNVPTFAKVKYENVYPGIDLVYYGNQGQLEYDFVGAPGANLRMIELSFPDAKTLSIDAKGGLVIGLEHGEVFERAPAVFQEVNGRKRTIAGRYILRDSNRVAFEMGTVDRSRAVVIDPAIQFSTYLGGSGDDSPFYMDVDRFGSVYVAGCTTSTDFPTTPDSLQSTFAGGTFGGTFDGDAFVTKLNPQGSAVVYSTYLGGAGDDCGLGIAVNPLGVAYLTGQTSSTDFPTTSRAFQPSFGGGNLDGFVAKLSADGSVLIYSTYLGGSGDDAALIGPTDSGGHVYAEGLTSSTDFPTTAGAFQRTYGGGAVDAFVSKLKADGSGLIFSTYLGGSGDDLGFDGTIDRFGNAYITGITSSADFPTTPRAFQRAYGGGDFDTFVTKVKQDGSGLVYSTYLGGSGHEEPRDLTVDVFGNAYVPGFTSSNDFPITPGAFQTSFAGGNWDGYVTKFNPAGTGVVYSTYLGGSGDDFAGAVRVDRLGNAYVPGLTSSTDFPTTANAFQSTYGGGNSDAFVTKLNPRGSGLLFSSYLGGSGDDGSVGSGTGIDRSGNVYVNGFTNSTDFPITKDAFQPRYGGGNSDSFVTKIVTGNDDGQPLVRRGAPGSAHPSDLAIPRLRMNQVIRDSH